MYRHLLRSAAVSILAAWASSCAETPASKPSATLLGSEAKAPTAAPATTADTGLHNLGTELQRAQSLRAQGQLTEATHVLAQLVLVAPDDARVVGEYGKVLVQRGRADDAAAFLKRATELKPTDWTLYSALGVAYDQMDDRKNAKGAYERALAIHPGDGTILNNYAVSRLLAGDYDTAQRLLLEAQSHGANNPKVVSNLQWLAERRASKASRAAPPATATAAATKPPRAIATVTPQIPPKVASANPVPALTPAQAKVIAAPAKPADISHVVASEAQQPAPKALSKGEAQDGSTIPKQTSLKAAVPAGKGRPRSIVMQPAPKDAATGLPQITASASRPDKPAVKAEKKLAQVATKPAPVKSAPATAGSGMVVGSKTAKPLKAGPPALRTADQGE